MSFPLYKGDNICSCDDRQVKSMIKNGWSRVKPKAEVKAEVKAAPTKVGDTGAIKPSAAKTGAGAK